MSSTDRSVSFYLNSSVGLDRLDSRSWDRYPVDSNANPYIYIYIYIYMCVCVCVRGPKRERNTSKGIGPRRDLDFLKIYLFISFFIYVYVSSLLLSSDNKAL